MFIFDDLFDNGEDYNENYFGSGSIIRAKDGSLFAPLLVCHNGTEIYERIRTMRYERSEYNR